MTRQELRLGRGDVGKLPGVVTPDGSGPEVFTPLVKSELAKWAKVAKESGLAAD